MRGGREGEPDVPALLAGLLESSDALAKSLSIHSPHFLEYLEKRRIALEALSRCRLSAGDQEALLKAFERGRSAQVILQRERERIEAEIAALCKKGELFGEPQRRARPQGLNVTA